MVIQPVLMALWQHKDNGPVILHSDWGYHFTSDESQEFPNGHNLICSMSDLESSAANTLVKASLAY
jgi:putative transposase